MKRILFILVLFISTTTLFGKSELSADNSSTFDQKVEQLFFKRDVSNATAALIDSLVQLKELKYTKPEGYTVIFSYTPIGYYTHTFDFNELPENPIAFQQGSIIVQVSAYDQEVVSDITWELQYSNKTDALNGFSDLFEYLSVPGAVHYLYHGKEIIEEAEFTYKASKKYPRISFKLIDNKGTEDGKYKIRLSLS